MQRLDLCPVFDVVEMQCLPDCDEVAPLVVIELRVPPAATVPAPRRRAAAALPVVRPASVTSTVASARLTQLRANNSTALAAAWCTTATLAFSS